MVQTTFNKKAQVTVAGVSFVMGGQAFQGVVMDSPAYGLRLRPVDGGEDFHGVFAYNDDGAHMSGVLRAGTSLNVEYGENVAPKQASPVYRMTAARLAL